MRKKERVASTVTLEREDTAAPLMRRQGHRDLHEGKEPSTNLGKSILGPGRNKGKSPESGTCLDVSETAVARVAEAKRWGQE